MIATFSLVNIYKTPTSVPSQRRGSNGRGRGDERQNTVKYGKKGGSLAASERASKLIVSASKVHREEYNQMRKLMR